MNQSNSVVPKAETNGVFMILKGTSLSFASIKMDHDSFSKGLRFQIPLKSKPLWMKFSLRLMIC